MQRILSSMQLAQKYSSSALLMTAYFVFSVTLSRVTNYVRYPNEALCRSMPFQASRLSSPFSHSLI